MREHDDPSPLGRVLRPHGLKGKVKVRLVVVCPIPSLLGTEVLVGEPLQPRRVVSVQSCGVFFLLQLEGVTTLEQAEDLRDAWLYLSSVGAHTPSDAYPLEELVGMELYDEEHLVGRVACFYASTCNPLLGVVTTQGHESLVPAHTDILGRVDRGKRKIYARLPEGLVEA